MCGIVGYIGERDCTDVLMQGLEKLEYRGYDSAGIAVFEKTGIKTVKTKGKLADMRHKLEIEGSPVGHCGIGHTRWATHGEPSDLNSHPHTNGRVTIVHNGIIENYIELKEFLTEKGYTFTSQTDTEVVACLLDYYYSERNPLRAIMETVKELQGSYALGIIFRDFPDRVYATRKESPLIVGIGDNEYFIGSDIPAFLKYTKKYVLLDDDDIVCMTDDMLRDVKRVFIVACGTAMHAGIIARYAIEQLARVPVTVEVASEFRYMNPIVGEGDLVIVVSQSGETADTKAGLELAKSCGAKTLAVVNVKYSAIARQADMYIHTLAGPEIAVASTKAYTAQISVLYLLAFRFAFARGKIDLARLKELTSQALSAPAAIQRVIDRKNECQFIASKLVSADNLFFIGRSFDYALSLEGSLKLKEISYIHSEAYAAGELKHGTISLIEPGIPVITVATQGNVLAKTISNMEEVKARGGMIIAVCRKGTVFAEGSVDLMLEIDAELDDMLLPLPTVCALQLIAYYTSVLRGIDPDKPRNLAKAVTTE